MRHPYIFRAYGSTQTNPAPWVEPDGTLYVVARMTFQGMEVVFHFPANTLNMATNVDTSDITRNLLGALKTEVQACFCWTTMLAVHFREIRCFDLSGKCPVASNSVVRPEKRQASSPGAFQAPPSNSKEVAGHLQRSTMNDQGRPRGAQSKLEEAHVVNSSPQMWTERNR